MEAIGSSLDPFIAAQTLQCYAALACLFEEEGVGAAAQVHVLQGLSSEHDIVLAAAYHAAAKIGYNWGNRAGAHLKICFAVILSMAAPVKYRAASARLLRQLPKNKLLGAQAIDDGISCLKGHILPEAESYELIHALTTLCLRSQSYVSLRRWALYLCSTASDTRFHFRRISSECFYRLHSTIPKRFWKQLWKHEVLQSEARSQCGVILDALEGHIAESGADVAITEAALAQSLWMLQLCFTCIGGIMATTQSCTQSEFLHLQTRSANCAISLLLEHTESLVCTCRALTLLAMLAVVSMDNDGHSEFIGRIEEVVQFTVAEILPARWVEEEYNERNVSERNLQTMQLRAINSMLSFCQESVICTCLNGLLERIEMEVTGEGKEFNPTKELENIEGLVAGLRCILRVKASWNTKQTLFLDALAWIENHAPKAAVASRSILIAVLSSGVAEYKDILGRVEIAFKSVANVYRNTMCERWGLYSIVVCALANGIVLGHMQNVLSWLEADCHSEKASSWIQV